jgi:hypothetical protein
MRMFSSRISETVSFAEPAIPASRLGRVNPPVRPAVNLLDEAVADVFNQACLLADLPAAGDLLALMAKWHERRQYADEHARRTDQTALRRMHGELERRHIMKGIPR